MRISLLVLGFAVASTTLSAHKPALAQSSDTAQAKRVVELRAQVEDLAHERQQQRKNAGEKLAALQLERADLERRIRLEQSRAKALAKMHASREERTALLEHEAQSWIAPLRAAVTLAQDHVNLSLPFKRDERLARLMRIEAELQSSHPDPAQALAQLWRSIEEEDALTQDVALASQPIDLEGQRVMADVARVAMALLYARLPHDTYARAEMTPQGWTFVRLDGQAAQATKRLFTAIEENRRYGQVPLLLPKSKELDKP